MVQKICWETKTLNLLGNIGEINMSFNTGLKRGSALFLSAAMILSMISGSVLAEEDEHNTFSANEVSFGSMSPNTQDKKLDDMEIKAQFKILTNATPDDLAKLDYLRDKFIQKLKDEDLLVWDDETGKYHLKAKDAEHSIDLGCYFNEIYQKELDDYTNGVSSVDISSLSLNCIACGGSLLRILCCSLRCLEVFHQGYGIFQSK